MLNKKNQSGFTIVEVMIVLAIAGLILAIVFIAVPALQRNSRNTQRRSDMASFRAQFETWTSNNNGKLPGDGAITEGLESIVGSTGWGHYNGNFLEPRRAIIKPGSSTVAASCSVATIDNNPANGLVDSAECATAGGVFTNIVTIATPGDTPEYTVGYARNLDPGAAPALLYPDRQEIHVFGEYACAGEILADGNDEDDGGVQTYAVGDLVESNARALAFVYQIEGEDNARCEDNV